MPDITIMDTSCLIMFHKIGAMHIPKELYPQIRITEPIRKEFGNDLPSWIVTLPYSSASIDKLQEFQLDSGEKSAFALALDHLQNHLLILDDKKARNIGRQLGLNITGTLGVLVKAKRKGLIEYLSPYIQKLLDSNFRLSNKVINEALREVNEQ